MSQISKNTPDQSEQKTGDSRLLVRAVSIIEAVSSSAVPIGVHDISRLTDIHPTTVLRISRTLCNYGWLIKDEDGKYRIGMSLYSIGCRYNQVDDLKEVAYGAMEKLSDQVKQPVNLMIRQNSESTLIQQIHQQNIYNTLGSVGSRLPLYLTACGKVMMSELPDTVLKDMIQSFSYQPYTPNSITSPERLLEQIKEVRKKGYAIDDQEAMWGAFCVAAPIRDESGLIIAGLSITSVVSYIRFKDEYIQAVKDYAARITDNLKQFYKERGYLISKVDRSRYV